MKCSFQIFWLFCIITYLFLINTDFLFASEDTSCEYQWQIDQCIEENQWWDPRSIEDFVCLQSTNTAEIAYQVVMDLKYKEIDKKAEKEVENIENNCETWYWENPTEDEITAPDKITSIYWVHGKHWQEYNKMLDPNNKEWILATTISCLWGKSPDTEASDFFSPALARGMFEQKLDMFEDTSYDALKLCKEKVRQDERKKMMQEGRKKYSSVTDLFQSVLWYLERIWKKWPSKTKNNYL